MKVHITIEIPCSVCGGAGHRVNPWWEKFFETRQTWTDREVWEFWSNLGYDEPKPYEEECPECKGAGVVEVAVATFEHVGPEELRRACEVLGASRARSYTLIQRHPDEDVFVVFRVRDGRAEYEATVKPFEMLKIFNCRPELVVLLDASGRPVMYRRSEEAIPLYEMETP